MNKSRQSIFRFYSFNILKENKKALICMMICTVAVFSCKEQTVKWKRSFVSLGTSSSPACIDLTGDGVLDCVIGAGLNEFDQTDSSVIAVNGANGGVLWAVPGRDQVIGTPVFVNITEDDVPDVIIGGRGAQLMAIDGASGTVIWEYRTQSEEYDPVGLIRFNFYTPQIIDDVDDDGIPEILISNGGNFVADPVSGNNRYPGVLAIMSPADGTVIAADTMPDGAETYMSPLYVSGQHASDGKIVFGSGGETFGGHLYEVSLSSLLKNDISDALPLLSREGHGFIAPPTITDITSDGISDIIVSWHGGEVIAIDGQSKEIIWDFTMPDTEIYACPTPGRANDDDIPDFFVQATVGKWPKYTGAYQYILDGKTGLPIYEGNEGCGSFSTALSADLDHDGYSEFIYNLNDYNCTGIYLANTMYSLKKLNAKTLEVSDIIPPIKAKNSFTTPWMGTFEKGDDLNMLICVQANYNDVFGYYGMHLYRYGLHTKEAAMNSWNQYLGPYGNGGF